jgi:addiction module RelB/DinJ family antitoxin
MTEQVRYRIDKGLVKEVERICRDMGITPAQAVSMFFAQIVKLGGLPFRPAAYPALEEYGVTLEEAEAALAKISRELDKEFEAGQMVEFKGKGR